jgi:hypothetical protein
LNINKVENGFTIGVEDLEDSNDWGSNYKTYVFSTWSDVVKFVEKNEIKNV